MGSAQREGGGSIYQRKAELANYIENTLRDQGPQFLVKLAWEATRRWGLGDSQVAAMVDKMVELRVATVLEDGRIADMAWYVEHLREKETVASVEDELAMLSASKVVRD